MRQTASLSRYLVAFLDGMEKMLGCVGWRCGEEAGWVDGEEKMVRGWERWMEGEVGGRIGEGKMFAG